MLPQLASMMATRGVEVVLLFGARTPAELIYGEDFYAFAEAHPGFRFVPCFSRELPARPARRCAPRLRAGRLAEFAPDARARHRLPVRQPEHGRRLLRGAEGAGLPVPHIRREKYVSSK